MDLQVIFYQPDQPDRPFEEPPRRTQPASQSRWEKLAERVWRDRGCLKRLETSSIVTMLPKGRNDDAYQAAVEMANNPGPGERTIQHLLLLTLCDVLFLSGQTASEDLDTIIKSFVKSGQPKYLDKLKRGARTANQVIVAWAGGGTGDGTLSRLDRATQAVMQARLPVSQWAILSECSGKVTEHIASKPLPEIVGSTDSPLLIPNILSYLTKGSLRFQTICRCLKYGADLALLAASVPEYVGIRASAVETVDKEQAGG